MSAIGASTSRAYGTMAITLHWVIAALLVGQIGLGWYMGDLPDHSAAQRTLEALHISLGLTILTLTVLRLGVAIAIRPPSLPGELVKWERGLAKAVHVLFYILLFALPLSGWAMESLGPRPIPFWGLVWPHMPAVGTFVTAANRRQVQETLALAHTSILVWTTIALIGLHILGAIKHQFDGAPVFWRMIPWMRRG